HLGCGANPESVRSLIAPGRKSCAFLQRQGRKFMQAWGNAPGKCAITFSAESAIQSEWDSFRFASGSAERRPTNTRSKAIGRARLCRAIGATWNFMELRADRIPD